ncbi:hypothetical protein A6E15_01630 [Natrinema saccharevitans]|uniref:Uncharacterized protein n=1 Tax=Natrinema saccharevitans TaxID=301967 RepID=A0A1S8ASH8_9EURY|nr:HTH domain-containing protein [Natrinema saccharevitans]OLZ39763.1 hypothetical protein A6E15_01630 [Natrinema saccharevitans]
MSDREPAVSVIADPDAGGAIGIDCYVRSSVPAAVSERIAAVTERLRTLRERGYVDELRVDQWPPQHAPGPTRTRDELVAEFERWADRHGYCLEPGFRRRTVPRSSFGVDIGSHERVRVPLVALALYEGADDAETLRAVLPCTELSYTGNERTYTVDEWLTAVETRAFDEPVRASRIDGPEALYGRQ